MIKLLQVFAILAISLKAVAIDEATEKQFSFEHIEQPVVVGYLDFKPLYGTVNNKPQGILADITRKVFEQLPLDYKERVMPTKRLFTSLKNGRVQMWCGIIVDELQSQVWSGNVVLHNLSLNLYTLSNPVDIVKKSELKGKKIILLLGYSYGGLGEYIRNKENGVRFIDVKSHDDALRLLRTGRYQYLLNYRAPMNIALEKMPTPELKHSNISELPIVFNVTKNMQDGKKLLEQLDKTLAQLIKAGQIKIQ